jgi:hypothetical protein
MNRNFVSVFARSALVVVMALSTLWAPTATSAQDQKTKPLKVCQNDDGTPKRGAIDVVMLLDNSRSLTTPENPTDPKGLRFDAIRDLLNALDDVSSSEDGETAITINFGLVSFGKNATVQIPLAPLESPDEVDKTIRKKLPNNRNLQEKTTDYVRALETAIAILENRPETNCKMLIWFTDGQYESDELREDDDDFVKKSFEQASELRRKICGTKDKPGIADRMQALPINTFVLVLKPSTKGVRLEASYGAMQAITGSTVIPPGITSDSDMCGNPADRDHLGDILVADDAASIARKIPTIGNTIDGWQPVRICPLETDGDTMPKMPAARHLKSMSFTAYGSNTTLKSLSSLRILDGNGKSYEFSEFLQPIERRRSNFEERYTFNKKADETLNFGWTFSLGTSEKGWCVQVLHREFSVRFTDSGVIDATRVKRLTPKDVSEIKYRVAGTEEYLDNAEDARQSSKQVLGFLDIDKENEVYKDPIPVKVEQLNIPLLDCNEFDFSVKGQDMKDNRIERRQCVIKTTNSTLEAVQIEAIAGPNLSTKGCDAELLVAQTEVGQDLDESATFIKNLPNKLTHKKGEKSLHLVLKFNNGEAKCQNNSNGGAESETVVRFAFGSSKPIEIPVVTNIDLRQKPDKRFVFALAFGSLLIVVLLNLLLMRWLMSKSARISRAGVDAYEVPVLIRKGSDGRLEVRLADGSASMTHVLELDRKIALRVSEDGRSAVLNGGSRSKLKVVLPALYQPFGDALIVIDSPKAALYWQQQMNRRGLQPHIKAGLVIHSPARNGEAVQATATFLLPSQGLDRQTFIRDVLGSRISMALQSLLAEPDWFADETPSQGSGPSRPSASSPSSSDTPAVPPSNSVSDTGLTRRPPSPPPPPRR